MNSESNFNGEKLRLARLLNGLTQQELGERIYASRQFVHQLESDVREPAVDVLDALCEILLVSKKFFIEPLRNEVKHEQCHFRKRKTTPVGVANRVIAFSTVFEQLIGFINTHLDLPEVNFPSAPHDGERYTTREIESAAYECRLLWGLGDGPISNVTRALENAGVVITQFTGVSDKVDALSLNRKYPIIVRNDAKKSTCRMRFDLAHECGHFVLHEGTETGDHATESEADRFASDFLFPRTTFVQEFPDFKGRSLNWNLIYDLKIRWGMSARAIIYKAHANELITAQQYRGANVHLNRTGQTKKEKFDANIQEETPELLTEIFETLSTELGISFKHIANVLGVNPDMLEQITGILPLEQNHLKNVVPLNFS